MEKGKKTNIKSTKDRLRLSIYRSNKHIFAQIIDDVAGHTLASSSTLKQDITQNIEGAKEAGKTLAENAKKQKIKQVVFDRGKFKYEGRVKAFADAAREHGLDF